MKKIKKSKFDLEKFEVVKLRNLKSINGGLGDKVTDVPPPPTIDLTVLLGSSSNRCAD